jgi:putative transposase
MSDQMSKQGHASKIFDPVNHHRRSIRLNGYDYTRPGAYFLTLVTRQRELLFGEITSEKLKLNAYGKIVDDTWKWLGTHYPYVEPGDHIVMPNHFHGILIIHMNPRRGDSRSAPTEGIRRKPLGQLVGALKTVSTKQINILRGTAGAIVWQRNYYEHIIRDNQEFRRIEDYIASNPIHWAEDNENPLTPYRKAEPQAPNKSSHA